MEMEQTECSETSAYKIQTPGNYPKETIQYKLLLFYSLYFVEYKDKYFTALGSVIFLGLSYILSAVNSQWLTWVL
jgi:hypothetical protein